MSYMLLLSNFTSEVMGNNNEINMCLKKKQEQEQEQQEQLFHS